jgi:hypothetical protein
MPETTTIDRSQWAEQHAAMTRDHEGVEDTTEVRRAFGGQAYGGTAAKQSDQ